MKTRDEQLSRRHLLKKGAAAAAGGALIASGGAARSDARNAQAPAVVTARRFRGWVSRGTGRGRTTLQELTLRAITGRQVLVRTEATNLCYSNTGAVLGIQPAFGPPNANAPQPAPPRPAAPPPGSQRALI